MLRIYVSLENVIEEERGKQIINSILDLNRTQFKFHRLQIKDLHANLAPITSLAIVLFAFNCSFNIY